MTSAVHDRSADTLAAATAEAASASGGRCAVSTTTDDQRQRDEVPKPRAVALWHREGPLPVGETVVAAIQASTCCIRMREGTVCCFRLNEIVAVAPPDGAGRRLSTCEAW